MFHVQRASRVEAQGNYVSAAAAGLRGCWAALRLLCGRGRAAAARLQPAAAAAAALKYGRATSLLAAAAPAAPTRRRSTLALYASAHPAGAAPHTQLTPAGEKLCKFTVRKILFRPRKFVG